MALFSHDVNCKATTSIQGRASHLHRRRVGLTGVESVDRLECGIGLTFRRVDTLRLKSNWSHNGVSSAYPGSMLQIKGLGVLTGV